MRIYLSLGDIPELSNLSSAERRRMARACLRRAARTRQFWMRVVAPQLIFFTAMTVGLFYAAGRMPLGGFTLACIAVVTCSTLMGLLIQQIYTHLIVRHVRDLMPGHCACCGYNLKGNASGVCPECGTAVPVAP
jgi:hypothetical protein